MQSIYSLAKKSIIPTALVLASYLPFSFQREARGQELGGLVGKLEQTKTKESKSPLDKYLFKESEIPRGFRLLKYSDLPEEDIKKLDMKEAEWINPLRFPEDNPTKMAQTNLELFFMPDVLEKGIERVVQACYVHQGSDFKTGRVGVFKAHILKKQKNYSLDSEMQRLFSENTSPNVIKIFPDSDTQILLQYFDDSTNKREELISRVKEIEKSCKTLIERIAPIKSSFFGLGQIFYYEMFEFPEPIRSISKINDEFMAQSEDYKSFYSLKTQRKIAEFPIEVTPPTDIIRDRFLALANKEVYDFKTKRVISRFQTSLIVGNSKIIQTNELLYFHKNGNLLGLDHGSYRLYNVLTGEEIAAFPTPESLNELAVSRVCSFNEKILVQGKDMKTFFDIKTGKIERKLQNKSFIMDKIKIGQPYDNNPKNMGISELSEASFFIEYTNLRKIYDFSTGELVQEFPEDIMGDIFELEDSLIVASSVGSSFQRRGERFYDLKSGRKLVEFPQPLWIGNDEHPIINLDRRIVVQGKDEQTFYDFKDGKEIISFPNKVRSAVFEIDKHFVVEEFDVFSDSVNGNRLYDFMTGEIAIELPQPIKKYWKIYNIGSRLFFIPERDNKVYEIKAE